jgi:hypothetical protein
MCDGRALFRSGFIRTVAPVLRKNVVRRRSFEFPEVNG